MKYLVDEQLVDEETFWSEFESALECYVDDCLDDLIDEENEEVCIGSLTYSPSQVLKEVDPIAYRCYGDDLKDHFYRDFKYDFDRGQEVYINGTSFIIEDNDEDEEEEAE